nr:transmembrane protein 65 [Hymenolepis microstoma]
MAAAGIGNLISDLCGLGLVGYVERYATLFGVKSPPLTESQLQSVRVRRYLNLGRMCGITLGCLIGMMPLLFFPNDEKEVEVKKLSGSIRD